MVVIKEDGCDLIKHSCGPASAHARSQRCAHQHAVHTHVHHDVHVHVPRQYAYSYVRLLVAPLSGSVSAWVSRGSCRGDDSWCG